MGKNLFSFKLIIVNALYIDTKQTTAMIVTVPLNSFKNVLTETIQEQHCQDRDMMESLSRGGLAILSTILSPLN